MSMQVYIKTIIYNLVYLWQVTVDEEWNESADFY